MADKKFYDAIKGIYSGKGQWDAADKAGDEAKKQAVASDTQRYYDTLNRLGYGEVAKEFKNSNYDQARSVLNRYLKQGNTAIRPYFYSLGKQYGYSTKDIDNMLKFDNDTGEVSFAGRNIGKPQSIVDGVSYWQESDLDKIFSDTMKNIGASKTPDALWNQAVNGAYTDSKKAYDKTYDYLGMHDTDLRNKVNTFFNSVNDQDKDYVSRVDRLQDMQYNFNPYDSEIGKSIMADYQWKGNQAASNEAASSGSTNGGNIDSFAAANAARQQLAFENAGKAAVREDFNTRLQNIQNTLDQLSTHYDRGRQSQLSAISILDNSAHQTADQYQDLGDRYVNSGLKVGEAIQNKQQSDAAINSQKMDDLEKEAKITGYVPAELAKKRLTANNPFFNSDGTLINPYLDYQDIINNAPDEQTKKNARVARAYKVLGDYGFDEWANTLDLSDFGQEQESEEARQFNKQDNTTRYLTELGYKNDQTTLDKKNAHEKEMADVNADAAIKVNSSMTDDDIRMENAKHENTMEEDAQNNKSTESIAAMNLEATKAAAAAAGTQQGATSSEKNTVQDSVIKDFVESFGEQLEESLNLTGPAFTSAGVNSYAPANETVAIETAKRIAQETDLTPGQIAHLVKKLGIPAETAWTYIMQ